MFTRQYKFIFLIIVSSFEERWPSGRRRTPGKCVGGRPSPGFESLSLRQILHIALIYLKYRRFHDVVYAKWFSEPKEIFETERCLGSFIDGAKILNDRLVESKISNETRRLIDMAVRNDRGYPYILRFEYITDYNDLNDMDQIGGECYVIQLEG